MKKLCKSSLQLVLSVVFELCKAFVLWYMYRNEMPGIPDVETWLCE